jgi:hypothetical protein
MAKSNAPIGLLIVFGIIVYILKAIFELLKILAIATLIIFGLLVLYVLFYRLYLAYYFKSQKFLAIKSSIEAHVQSCNELNKHIDELEEVINEAKSKNFGDGQLIDASTFNYKRYEWQNLIRGSRTYNCSATICRNASNQPIKYLCKYFDIELNEETLQLFEEALNNLAAAEQGKVLLVEERNRIIASISSQVPVLIYQNSKPLLIERLGFIDKSLSSINYPIYTFQYVSAGGYSSTKCEIQLNLPNLEKLIYFINEDITRSNSIQRQRALMTRNLREKIKVRDGYTCRICQNSNANEENLLLEIDHIIPLSKGGKTTEENLQTLCWKCNRRKGAKLELLFLN